MIHDYNWTRRDHTTIAACMTWKKSIGMLHDERKFNLRVPLRQWTIDNINIQHPGNGPYPLISTHSITENMEHGVNTHDVLTNYVGALYSKHIQSEVLNASLATKYVESV